MYNFVVICISLFISVGMQGDSAGTLLERKISLDMQNVTVHEMVDTLLMSYAVPISFIEYIGDDAPIKSDFKCSNCTIDELLRQVVTKVPNYKYDIIEGHLVLFSIESLYQEVIEDLEINDVERLDGEYLLVEKLRGSIPGFSDLGGAVMRGDPSLPIFTDHVSVAKNVSLLKCLVQLIGKEDKIVFILYRTEKGNRFLDYVQLR